MATKIVVERRVAGVWRRENLDRLTLSERKMYDIYVGQPDAYKGQWLTLEAERLRFGVSSLKRAARVK